MLLLPLALAASALTGCVADPGPIMVGAVPGDRTATVTWLPPVASTTPIVAYVVTPHINHSAGIPMRFNSTATTQTVKGLSNGYDYTFTVAAITALGSETASSEESNALAPGPQITTGNAHSCAIRGGGAVYCWGSNSAGQLGIPTSTTQSTTPVPVSGVSGAIAIAAGYIHTCALLADRTATCWGNNTDGQLGNGTTVSSSTPVPVTGLTGVTGITAENDQTCAVIAPFGMYCWGRNSDGQLGNGTTTPNSSTPVHVSGLTGVVDAATGDTHACALKFDGTVWCWGKSTHGALGNEDTFSSPTPVQVVGLSGARGVSAGYETSCALVGGGSAMCWGIGHPIFDPNGEAIGFGSSFTPTTVSGVTGAAAIATGGLSESCAIVSGGTATCWSYNGHGETASAIPGLTGITSIAVAKSGVGFPTHTCALTASGAGYCWGFNSSGELGNGTTTSSSTPVAVAWP